MTTTNERRLLETMQDVGREVLNYANSRFKSNERHYMVTYLVTEAELKNGDIQPLQKIKSRCNELVSENKLVINDRYIQFGRFLFLMNLYDKSSSKSWQHTEKRLFDPHDSITDTWITNASGIKDGGYMKKMKDDFARKFGKNTSFRVLVFTHYIPCMQPHHQCANLLARYADLRGYMITIGWAEKYRTTDIKEVYDVLNESNNITVIQIPMLEPTATYQLHQPVSFPSRHDQEVFNTDTTRFYRYGAHVYNNYFGNRPNVQPYGGQQLSLTSPFNVPGSGYNTHGYYHSPGWFKPPSYMRQFS